MAAGKASTQTSNNPANAPVDSRVYLMRSIFRDPWKSLLQTAAHAKSALAESNSNEAKDVASRKNIVKGSREQIQTASWLILLDFAKFLAEEMPRIWNKLNNPTFRPLYQMPKTRSSMQLRM